MVGSQDGGDQELEGLLRNVRYRLTYLKIRLKAAKVDVGLILGPPQDVEIADGDGRKAQLVLILDGHHRYHRVGGKQQENVEHVVSRPPCCNEVFIVSANQPSA